MCRALEIERCCACHCHERKRKGIPFQVTFAITCACNGGSKRLAKVEALNLGPSVGIQAAAADEQAFLAILLSHRVCHSTVKTSSCIRSRMISLKLTASGFCPTAGFVNCVCRFSFSPFPQVFRITSDYAWDYAQMPAIFRCPQIALLGTSYGTSEMLTHDRHSPAATPTIQPSSLCQFGLTPCIMTSARPLLLLAIALLAVLHPATAATDVLQGDIYLMDSVHQIDNYTDLKAGQSYVANFQVNDQASNATIGSVLGFCTVLRDVGPSQCQYTIQLASGSVQVLASR